MLILVCYDVSTETPEGRRRLRRVAIACEARGERVQKSVFECRLTPMQMEALEKELLEEIDETEDCLRLYRLQEPLKQNVKEYGKFSATNFEDPLII